MKKRKYGNVKIERDGITFDSYAEYRYYLKLVSDKLNGLILDFQLQPTYELQPSFKKNGKTHRAIKYVADFLVTYSDGRKEIIDVKGNKTKEFAIKHKMFEYKYPDLGLKIVEAYAKK